MAANTGAAPAHYDRTAHPGVGESMARVSRDLELCYQVDGNERDPAVVLIAGLSQQLNEWPPELVRGLVDEGFRVVRFDNRDVGRSSRLPIAAPSTVSVLLQRGFRTEQYTVGDMALDTLGLLDRLSIERAHLVGMSMGGMIGQMLAARHPSRVLTLTSLMSNTGARRVGRPRLSTYLRLYAPPKLDRDGFADQWVEMMRHIGSRGFPFDDARVRATGLEAFDRGGGANVEGVVRQLAAIWKSGDRTKELQGITVPTLVIHGDRDPMLAASGGRATARAIPGSRLVIVRGMGHDLPAGACPQLVRAIVDHARRVKA
jgi:pimeloyl-ACP methyl ester carboxylesterase